jgi:methylthioribose-1-phosphate isomerase
MSFFTLQYRPASGTLVLLDQTRLPDVEDYLQLDTVEHIAQAIERLAVRGAPAIGIAAGFAIAVAARSKMPLPEAEVRLARTRPTAVNLFWALARMKKVWGPMAPGALDIARIEAEAQAIYDDEVAASVAMGKIGAPLIADGDAVLTHCNAGALATAELGTALAVIRAAHKEGKSIRVFAGETRPLLQGARLTAWELMKDGIDVTLIPDSAVAYLLGEDKVQLAVVGADRIARNGDTANKIGTRGIACLFSQHGRPVYVAAPWSTVDRSIPDGRAIPIEQRSADEVRQIRGLDIAPPGVKVLNPAFDVTPAGWLAGIITERGFTGPAIAEGLARLDAAPHGSGGDDDTAPTAIPRVSR